MIFQVKSDRVYDCGFVAAILNMFKLNLKNRQAEKENEKPEIEEIFSTASVMILLFETKLAEDFFIGERRARHDSSGRPSYWKTGNERRAMKYGVESWVLTIL